MFVYGAVAYINASPNKTKLLDLIHNTGIHTALRIFPTTLIANVQLLSGYPLLTINRVFTLFSFYQKVKQSAQHINYTILNSQSNIFGKYRNEWNNTLEVDLQTTRPQKIKKLLLFKYWLHNPIISYNPRIHYELFTHTNNTRTKYIIFKSIAIL